MTDTISVRVSSEMKGELKKFAEDEKLEQTSEIARKLLILGLNEWHKKRALRLFSSGKITLSKGAALAQMDTWSFAELIRQRGTAWIKEKRFVEKDFTTKL